MYIGGAYIAQTYISGFVLTVSSQTPTPTPPTQGGNGGRRPRAPDIFNSRQADRREEELENPVVVVVHQQPTELVPAFKLTETPGAGVLVGAGGDAVLVRPAPEPVIEVRMQLVKSRIKAQKPKVVVMIGDPADDEEAIWAVLMMVGDGDV